MKPFKSLNHIFMLILILITWVASDFCNIDFCEDPRKHVMCLYPDESKGENCKNYTWTIINEIEAVKILKGHEKIGQDFETESSVTLKKLKWDRDLQTLAQRWADQCSESQDECRSLEKYDSAVLQNIHVTTVDHDFNGSLNYDKIATNWSLETEVDAMVDYDRIGCGLTRTSNNDLPGLNDTIHLVCNYAVSSDKSEYCNVALCENPKKHVMCLYSNDTFSTEKCFDYTLNLMDDEHVMGVMQAHDNIRKSFEREFELNYAMKLKWDVELQALAQRLANQCSGRRDECRSLDKYKTPVLQNLVAYSLGDSGDEMLRFNATDFQRMIDTFWSYQHEPFQSEILGDYDRIGCGLTRTYFDGAKHVYDTLYFICNYAKSSSLKNYSVLDKWQNDVYF